MVTQEQLKNQWAKDNEKVRELEQRLEVLKAMASETQRQLAAARKKMARYEQLWLEVAYHFTQAAT